MTPKLAPLEPIKRDELPDFIGKHVHVSWASHGCVWVLDKVENGIAFLRTPKTGKKLEAPVGSLRKTRKHERKVDEHTA